MDFGLSLEISEDIFERNYIVINTSKSLEEYFKDKDFGEGIVNLTIGIICVNPNFDSFFKIYSERLPEFKLLMDEGVCTLKNAINMSGIKVHSITQRIKGFDSCVNKVIEKKIEEPFEGIKDFVGLRVVCLFLSDLDRVEKVINQTFEIISKKDCFSTVTVSGN